VTASLRFAFKTKGTRRGAEAGFPRQPQAILMVDTPPPERSEPKADASATPARSKKVVAMLLMGGALMGKLLGFVREVLMAQIVGVAMVADGFRTSITAILLPLAFLQNESVPAIMIPMMQDGHKRGDAPQRLAGLSIALTLVGVVLMVLMLLLGDWMVRAMVAGFPREGQEMTLHFVRIMSLSMPASVLLNCLCAGEIAIGRTRLTNLRAGVLNVGVITGLGLLVLTSYVYVLGWTFAAAFNLLAIWGSWRLVREGNLSFSGVTLRLVVQTGVDFFRRLRPFLLLPGAEQANVWMERLFASRIVGGAVASLDYARTLTDSAFLLFSQPIGLAFLAEGQTSNERRQAEAIARPLLAVAVPFSAFVYMFSEDIVRLIFHRGAFDEHGVLLTSHALSGIALGLWASTLGWVLLRLLNRSGRNVTAAFILISAYAVNIGLNLILQRFDTAHEDGVFLLGLGETARNLVLLTGVVVALSSVGVMLRLVVVALLPAVLMAAFAWQIEQFLPASFLRLVFGGMAWTLCTLLASWLLCPELLRAGFARIYRGLFKSNRT